jgi:DNA-binding response OmpR family regulator
MSRILLVNDEEDLVEISEMVLKDAGFQVTSLTDGRMAADTAFRTHPDILVLDWDLTYITAEDVMRQMRMDPRTAKMPVLLISANVDGEVKARMYGVDGYLQKPFTAEQLEGAVRALLARVPGEPAGPPRGPGGDRPRPAASSHR